MKGKEKPTATTVGAWGRGTGPALHAVQLAALGPAMRPSDQLRYRAPVDPGPPSASAHQVSRRARNLPGMLWPHWSLRLSLADGTHQRVLAPVLAAAVLLVNSRIELDRAATILGRATDGTSLSRLLQLLEQDAHWNSVATALIRLAEHLDTSGSPIDYARRRGLDYATVLSDEDWSAVCREANQPPGSGRRVRVARCVLFSRISGSPIDLAPAFPHDQASRFRTETARFTEAWTPQLAQGLETVADDFLARGGVRGEPIAWHPPTSLLDGIGLPEPEIDIDRLHQLTRVHGLPAGGAAAALGVSIEAVRHTLAQQPAPPTPLTPAQARARGDIRRAARSVLSDEDLRRRYIEERQSARAIAQELGVSRQTVTRLAAYYGIPLQRGRPAHPRIDRSWLITQYVELRRTLPDIAQEVGVSTTCMNRWARELEVPLRPRGGGSHREVLQRSRSTSDNGE